MKLRTKLLLGVGILLFAMAVITFLLPLYFVRKDVKIAQKEIHELLNQEHNELRRSQKLWLEDELRQITLQVDAMLSVVAEEPAIGKTVEFGKTAIWGGLANLIASDPQLGFIQAHAPSQKETAVLTPHSASLYPAQKLSDALIQLDDTIYAAYPLPDNLQDDGGYTLYALLDQKHADAEHKVLEQTLSQLNGEEKLTAFSWAVKVDLIQTLAPLFTDGVTVEGKGKVLVPEGIAKIDATGDGVGLRTSEAFHTELIFDDVSFYEGNPPKPGEPPFADGLAIITHKATDEAYIGNTLRQGSTLLTIGTPLIDLLMQLARSSGKMVLLEVGESLWIGVNAEGKRMDSEQIEELLTSGLVDQRQGVLQVGKQAFFYTRLTALERSQLQFYAFTPADQERKLVATLDDLKNRLSTRISIQLLAITLSTMVLALLLIWRMAYSVIKPITKLASATEAVAAGRYEDVELPDVGRRKDEVATLTTAFGQMVHGLQDRERIRGVLDKVVSKDVADEILRTQVHLGGEDRIVTMLFSDIRGFSELTENSPPQSTIGLLNGCMTKVSRVIEGEGGVIDKYVGDEVMALFGAPSKHDDDGVRAISSGLLIIETLKKWNEERRERGEPTVEMGIGIHTGLVVAGNMGAEDRLNYTVLGSNVNLAARLCEVAEPNELIISEATFAEPGVEEAFIVKARDPIVPKGFSEPVSIYEVIGFKWE